MDILTFVLISFVFIVIPGPNVLLVVSTALSHGMLRAMQTIIGIGIAMGIQLLFAAMATSWLVKWVASGFFWLKWCGVAYLLYLAARHLYAAFSDSEDVKEISAAGSVQRGFWVSLTNPKTILFFSAFLPQFTSGAQSFLHEILLLSLIFWLMALVIDACYAFLASLLAEYLQRRNFQKRKHGLSGILYLGAAAFLGSAKA